MPVNEFNPVSQAEYYENKEAVHADNSSTFSAITQIVVEIFESIGRFFEFFSRYKGSPIKGPNGNYDYQATRLPDGKAFLNSALVAVFIHDHKSEPRRSEMVAWHLNKVVPAEELPGYELIDKSYIFDPNTGLKAMLVESNETVFISFGAVKSSFSELSESAGLEKKLTDAAVTNLLGDTPAIYHSAENLVRLLVKNQQYKDKKVVLVGHCLGASLACYAGLKNHLPVHAFNSLALGAGLQQEIGDENLNRAKDYVTHISVKNDFTSDNALIGHIDRFISAL
jgi:hypothetical protein